MEETEILRKNNINTDFVIKVIQSSQQYFRMIEFLTPLSGLAFDKVNTIDEIMVSLGYKSITVPNKLVYLKKIKFYSLPSL